jgi:hypothetical protein
MSLRRMLTRLLVGCAVLLCAGQAAAADEPAVPGISAGIPAGPGAPENAAATPATAYNLRLPKDEAVSYRGLARFDNAGGPGAQILYPAPGIAGLLVAIATHSAIVEGQKKAEKDRIQAAADAVLVPYRTVLDGYTHRELMQAAIGKIAGAGKLMAFDAPAGGERVVESVPVFFMTSDARALVLDAAVVIYGTGGAQAPLFQNVVRVVSEPQGGSDLTEYWNANQGEQLKEKSVQLLTRALEIALAEVHGTPAREVVHRTVRYAEGGVERMERGQVLGEQCDRVLIKNLRGWLMSLPAKSGRGTAAAGSACPPPVDTAKAPSGKPD